MHQLSIVIVNYKVAKLVAQCLQSVEAATRTIDAEVWVVDNASGDNSISYLRKRFPWVNYIENTENLGFGRANNQAISRSDATYILTLNPDTMIGEQCLVDCLKHMQEYPECGAIGIKMHNIHGRYLPESKRGFPTPWVSFCKLFGLTRLFPRSAYFASYYMGHLSERQMQRVEVLSCAFALFRRAALNEIGGGFDESFFMYGEDIDLTYRIHLSRQYECHYLPIPMLHYKGESSILENNLYIHSFYGAMDIFYRKYYPKGGLGSWIISHTIRIFTALAWLKSHCPKARDRKASKPTLLKVELPLNASALPPSGSHLLINRADYPHQTIIDSLVRYEDRQYTYHFRNEEGDIISPKGF